MFPHVVRLAARSAFALAALAAVSCGGKGPPPSTPDPSVPGATVVTGRERLGWSQPGDLWQLTFRAYVNGTAVDLQDATCEFAAPASECTAALPALPNGVHTIEVAAVHAGTGAEGERSGAITVQKVSARAARTLVDLPDAGASRLEGAGAATVPVGPGDFLLADVIARDVVMPAQLAPLPDGRVLVAEAAGRVRLLYPDEPARTEIALDGFALLSPSPASGLAIAAHPDFAATRQAFVAYTYVEAGPQLRTRIVRLREAGDRLGEPVTIFDAPLAPDARHADDDGSTWAARAQAAGPRLAFGPDGLIYAVLPPGLTFDGQPAASAPLPAVVRVTADGRTPAVGGLTGVTAHPWAFAWHPGTGVLLGMLRDGLSGAIVQALGGRSRGAAAGLARFKATDDGIAPHMRFETMTAEGLLDLAQVAAGDTRGWPDGVVRLAVPADLDGLVPGLAGRLADLASRAGVVYAAVADEVSAPGRVASTGAVVRLRSRR